MKTYKFEITKAHNSEQNCSFITIEGILALQNSNEIKTDFIEILKLNTDYELVIQNTSAIDITFIQLLEAFKKSVKKIEKNVSIKYILSDEQKKIINKTNLITC